MSGNVVAWVYEHYPVDTPVDRNRKVVLSEVAEAADRDYGNAHPGVKKIAAHWGFDPGTVTRHLTALVGDGWLEVTEKGGGRGNATVYRVCRERVARCEGLPDANARIPGGKPAQSEVETRAISDPTPSLSSSSPVTPPAADRLLAAVSSVDVVFAAWLECASSSGRARLDKPRTRLITNALRDYPVEDVVDAVRGWQNDPWHAERRKCDLGYLLRDAEHIEKFRDLWRLPPKQRAAGGRAVDNDREGTSGRIQL